MNSTLSTPRTPRTLRTPFASIVPRLNSMTSLVDVPVGSLTTIGIASRADHLFEPANESELAAAAQIAMERTGGLRILGGGSNLIICSSRLVGDVISTKRLTDLSMMANGLVTVGAGFNLTTLIKRTISAGLCGLECLAGIPGTVGGAVAMNAGGRWGDTFDRLVRVRVLRAGRYLELGRDELPSGYRNGGLGDDVLFSATFQLAADRASTAAGRFSTIMQEKIAQQPYGVRSAGCLFKNPVGRSAGALIDSLGFKGFRVGGVSISTRHANFLINDWDGTAHDVRTLIATVRECVQERLGITLETEVRLWANNDFGSSPCGER